MILTGKPTHCSAQRLLYLGDCSLVLLRIGLVGEASVPKTIVVEGGTNLAADFFDPEYIRFHLSMKNLLKEKPELYRLFTRVHT